MLTGSLTRVELTGCEPPCPFSRMIPRAMLLEASSLISSGRARLVHPASANMFLISSLLLVPHMSMGGAAETWLVLPILVVNLLLAVTMSSI